MTGQLPLATLMALVWTAHYLHAQALQGCQCGDIRKSVNRLEIENYSVIPQTGTCNIAHVQVTLTGEKGPICLDPNTLLAKRFIFCTQTNRKDSRKVKKCICRRKNLAGMKMCQKKWSRLKGFHLMLRSVDK